MFVSNCAIKKDLHPDLSTVSVNSTTGVGQSKCKASLYGGEDTDHEPTKETRNHVRVHDTKTIVYTTEEREFLARDVHRGPRNRSRDQS
jgi:hypothetical protein